MNVVEEIERARAQRIALRDRVIEDVVLANVELSSLRSHGVVLRDVDLRAAQLVEVDWLECTLTDVRMRGAVLRGATLRMCTFERVQAASCDMRGAKLENSEAQGIVLDGADLSGGSLVDTDLTRATLRGAILRDVDASGATFRGADLRGADLRGASFVDADLRGADLRGAVLDEVDFDGADLRGVVLEGAADESAPTQPELANEVLPGYAALFDAVGPLVVDVLKHGHQRGVIDSDALARVMAELGATGIDIRRPLPRFDGLEQLLRRVSETGIGPLIAALRQGGDAPPPEVASFIESLIRDAELGEDATADDLVTHLAHLIGHLQPPASSPT